MSATGSVSPFRQIRALFHLDGSSRKPAVSLDQPPDQFSRSQAIDPRHLTWTPVEPGMVYSRFKLGQYDFYALKIDLKQPDLEIKPIRAPGRLGNVAPLPKLIKDSHALAAINTMYYRTFWGESEHLPLGILKIDGELLTGTAVPRASLGISRDGTVKIDRLTTSGQLNRSDGSSIAIQNLNQLPALRNRYFANEYQNYFELRGPWNENILFNRHFGENAPPMEDGMRQVQIRDGQVSACSENESLAIPKDGYVIAGLASDLASLKVGEKVDCQFGIDKPGWEEMDHVISGKPLLVKEGVVMTDGDAEGYTRYGFHQNIAPRVAAGLTSDNELLLLSNDGHYYQGPTVQQLAYLMKDLGVVDGLNLDGGTSTSMMVKGEYQGKPPIYNNSKPRPIPTGLVITRKAPARHLKRRQHREAG